MLAAHAGHAAAALDLLIALEDTRLEASRAGALLALAHELAAAEDVDAISAVVAEALPRVVGCSSASVMLWDPADGLLRARSSANLTEERGGHLPRDADPPGGHPRADGAAHQARAEDHPGRRQQSRRCAA